MNKAPVALLAIALGFGVSSRASAKTLIDYFLPVPVRGELSTNVWGAPNVLPRDTQNGLEDTTMKQWCYWDGKIIKGRMENSTCSPADGTRHAVTMAGEVHWRFMRSAIILLVPTWTKAFAGQMTKAEKDTT